MITFEHRILSEYRIKIAKIETLAKSIMAHQEPKGEEAKGASEFLDILINETDKFYENNSTVLSNNGKRPVGFPSSSISVVREQYIAGPLPGVFSISSIALESLSASQTSS